MGQIQLTSRIRTFALTVDNIEYNVIETTYPSSDVEELVVTDMAENVIVDMDIINDISEQIVEYDKR